MAVAGHCEIRSKEGLLLASLNPLLFIHVFIHSCPTLWPCGLSPAGLLLPWHSPGKNTGVGWHFLLQGIFLTQGSNPSLLHLLQWQVGSLPLCHLGIIHSFIHSCTSHQVPTTCQVLRRRWVCLFQLVTFILPALKEWVMRKGERG